MAAASYSSRSHSRRSIWQSGVPLYGRDQLRACGSSDGDLYPISRKVRQDAGRQGSGKCEFHLESEPGCAEKIAHSHAEDHAGDSGSGFPGETFHQEALDQGEENKSYEISPCGTGKFAEPAAEGRKYREPDGAETEIHKEAYSASFYFEQIYSEEDSEVCK